MDEEWRDIQGYEGLYQVSNLGRVKRVAGSPTCPVERFLKGMAHNCGAWCVKLSRENTPQHALIHRLVLDAFIGPCPAGHTAHHNDGNLINNRLTNLGYITFSETLNQGYADGERAIWDRKGEVNPRAKMTEAMAVEIKRRLMLGESPTDIAAEFSVTRMSIYDIRYKRSWSYLDHSPSAVG